MEVKSRLKSIRDHIRVKGIIPKKAKKALHLATMIVDKIPRRGDSTLQKFVKILSIADAVESTIQVKPTEITEIVERLELTTTTNTVFASMFFGTKLQEQFELKQRMFDGHTIVEATNAEHGTLIFIERWEKQYNPTFYHTKGFDFEKVLQQTWDLYDGRLQFELRWDKSVYTSFSTVPNPLYGDDAARMDKLVARHRRYQLDKMSRAYMMYGAPGTGKTSFAMAFADRIGNRILRIDARSFSMVSVSEVIFIIDALQPDFIMVDDVDKADVNNSLPTILGILQELKMHKTKTSLLLTANVVSTFDHGLLRPGRIDTWMTFGTPDAAARRQIIEGYMNDAKLVVSDDIIDKFVAVTEDLTQDYLREIAQRLKYEEVDEIIEVIMSMRELLKKPALTGAPAPEPLKSGVEIVESKEVTIVNGKSNGTAHA